MKKILFLMICLVFFDVSAQKITKEFLIGKWISESTEIEFSIQNKKDFKISSYSTVSGNSFKIIGYQFNKGHFYLKTLHESNNWEAIAKFFLIDENTLVANYACDSPGLLIYKRVLDEVE
jgi:hypothetical protein